MSTLTLVRHGQARPFEKDSDRLSDVGEQQARALGEYWRRQGIHFDEAVSGSLLRHQQTYQHAGLDGDCEIDPGWNEYHATEILEVLGPRLADQDAHFAARRQDYATSTDANRNRSFQKMLEILMDAWITGRVTDPSVESFAAFETRVLAALRRILDSGRSNRNVVVFTSGGPIGLCVQHVLRAPAQTFLDVNWRIRNASVTEFTFSSSSRVSLDTLNVLTHLDDRGLWTWR